MYVTLNVLGFDDTTSHFPIEREHICIVKPTVRYNYIYGNLYGNTDYILASMLTELIIIGYKYMAVEKHTYLHS